MSEIKDEPLKKLKYCCTGWEKQKQKGTYGKAGRKKWIKKDLLEESLSMFLVSQDRRKHDAVDMHCCETYTRSGGLAGWGGALLYLFRVGLLPLK